MTNDQRKPFLRKNLFSLLPSDFARAAASCYEHLRGICEFFENACREALVSLIHGTVRLSYEILATLTFSY